MTRHAFQLAALLVTYCCAIHAAAQAWPAKSVRVVMPFAAGGGLEAQARVIAQKLTETWGQPLIIDSRPGANGALGTQIVAGAAPDGYTLLVTNSSFATLGAGAGKIAFDPLRDFAAVIQIGVQPQILVAHPSLPATLREALARIRERPSAFNYASAGSTSQLTMELLKSMAGVELTHVPYKGSGPAVTALIGGEVQFAIFSANVVVPHVRTGRLRALGVTSAKPSAVLPDAPPIAAAGVPGYETLQWSAMLAPARTPRAVVAKLNAEIGRALHLDDVKQRLANLGVEPAGGTPDQFGDLLRTEIPRWARLVRERGLRIE